MKTIYKSIDGLYFEDKKDCEYHEKELKSYENLIDETILFYDKNYKSFYTLIVINVAKDKMVDKKFKIGVKTFDDPKIYNIDFKSNWVLLIHPRQLKNFLIDPLSYEANKLLCEEEDFDDL